MNFPLDVSTCRVLIIFVPNNYVGRNEWQSKRQGWPRRGSEDQVRDAMQQGKARRPRQCARHRVRMGRMPRARGRQQTLMCVSCVSCVYLCNDVCTYMLTHTVFTNTTCEEKKPQVHRRNQGPVAVRIQLQASQPLARRPLLVSVATGNQAREYTPGPRAGNATSDRACKFTAQLRAGAAGGWVYIYAPWPAGPPHAHRKFACLWSVCVHYQMNSTVAIWACSLRLAP
jgi:hypothetical protein